MWPSDVLFDRTVQPPMCSLRLRQTVCVREKREDSERHAVRDLLFLCVLHTDPHTPLFVRNELKAREKRLCLDSETTPAQQFESPLLNSMSVENF